jgi:hypothetical protein
MFVVTA